MNKDEKKDIEDLIKKLDLIKISYEQNGYMSIGNFTTINEAKILIEKQQKEINNLKDKNKDLLGKLKSRE